MSISKPPVERTKTITYFKGLKISVNNSQIDDENSPDMLNLLPSDRGALDKRPGRVNIFESLGTDKITGIHTYKKSTGDIHIFTCKDKFYKILDLDDGTYELEYTGLANSKIRGFTYNDLFYFLDGTTYRKYDGTTVSTVVGKIPTVAISTPPAGGGTLFEPLNYIQPGFTQSFSGDNTSTIYQLALTGLDATAVTATVNGVAKAETTDFTVNRTTGKVTFTVAPNNASPDNVKITAYKTFSGYQNEIFKCTIPYIWGGADGSKIWFAGNPDYPNRDYGSEIEDPTYFPVTMYDNLGSAGEPITGYSELYGYLLIFKKDSVYIRNEETNSDSETIYPAKRLTNAIGAEAIDSICILDDYPTFVNKKGVYQIISVDTNNEKIVRHISDDIDKNANVASIQSFISMGNLSSYVGIDYDSKYWLFNSVNGKVWVYDYRYIVNGIGQWFLLDNLYANCVLEINSTLYFGDSRKGLVHRLMDSNDSLQYNDIEESTTTAINAYWTSKVDNYDLYTNLKLVSKIFFDLKPAKKTSAILSTRSDLRSPWTQVKEAFASLFTYSLLAYSRFTYSGSTFPQQTRAKVKAKKIGYYQIKLSNNKVNESIGILSVSQKTLGQREVK